MAINSDENLELLVQPPLPPPIPPGNDLITLNNQNSILMHRLVGLIHWLLHDTRLFGFKKVTQVNVVKPGNQNLANTEYGSSHSGHSSLHMDNVTTSPISSPVLNSSQKLKTQNKSQDNTDPVIAQKNRELYIPTTPTDLILWMLTTPKYRAMKVVYILFRFLDNGIFILIIVTTITKFELRWPTDDEMVLYGALFIESWYDIMVYTELYWNLQRLRVHIGVILYALYAVSILLRNGVPGLDDKMREKYQQETAVIWWVVGLRFFSFVFECLADTGIDMVAHNDLLKLNLNEMVAEISESCCVLPDWLQKTRVDIRELCKLPQDYVYVGSIFVWGMGSVYTEKVWEANRIHQGWIVACFALPGIVSGLVLLLVLGLYYICKIISFLFCWGYTKLCTKSGTDKKNSNWNNWCKELTDF